MVLAFGVDSTTLIINASLPALHMDSTGQALKKAMFTAVYRKFNASPFSNAANYDIDVTGSPFILAKSASNSLVYTTDGKMPTENPEKTALLTTKSEGKLEFRDKKTFATDRIKQLPGIVAIQIDSIAEVTVNGLPAVEIIAYGEDRYTKEKNDLSVDGLCRFYLLHGFRHHQRTIRPKPADVSKNCQNPQTKIDLLKPTDCRKERVSTPEFGFF
ncbi:MAG: hypothetical protein IPP37_00040 [Saprospiraceae bacterium]|nr:hypothetical protein [Saprospiraceae bacterium]